MSNTAGDIGRAIGRVLKSAQRANPCLLEPLEPRRLFSAYTITPLVPAGYAGFEPKAINLSGQIAGDLISAANVHTAAIFSAGTYTPLNVGGAASYANAINASGQVAGT